MSEGNVKGGLSGLTILFIILEMCELRGGIGRGGELVCWDQDFS